MSGVLSYKSTDKLAEFVNARNFKFGDDLGRFSVLSYQCYELTKIYLASRQPYRKVCPGVVSLTSEANASVLLIGSAFMDEKGRCVGRAGRGSECKARQWEENWGESGLNRNGKMSLIG